MPRNTWRDSARPIIKQVLKETQGQTEKEIIKALKEAYPWGQRSLHPYKIWLDEIKVQRGFKRFGKKPEEPDPNQTELF